MSGQIGEGAEGAIDQGLPPLPLGPDRLVKGRQQAEIDIHRLERAWVGMTDVTDDRSEGCRLGQEGRGFTVEEADGVDPGQESRPG